MDDLESVKHDAPPGAKTQHSPSSTSSPVKSTVINMEHGNEKGSSDLLKEALCLLLQVFYGVILLLKQIVVNCFLYIASKLPFLRETFGNCFLYLANKLPFLRETVVNCFLYISNKLPFLRETLQSCCESVQNRARTVPMVQNVDRSFWKLFANTVARICPDSASHRRHLLVFSMGFILGSFIYVSTLNISYALHYQGRKIQIATTLSPVYPGLAGAQRTTILRDDTTPGYLPKVQQPLDYGRPSYGGSAPKRTADLPIGTKREVPKDMPRIPHILHQNWHTKLIPQMYSSWILSWRRNHPKWRHIFWTGRGGQQLVERAFPEYKSLYANYSSELHRFKVDRFFVLYHFGGVFVDMDIESLRPLDRLIDQYSCILTEQPLIHQALLFNQESPNYVVSSFMACSPGHPFLKFLLEMLETYQPYDSDIEPYIERVEKSVGSLFLGDALQLYKIAFNKTVAEEVLILPPDWLMPNYNEQHRGVIAKRCTSGAELNPDQQRLCGSLLRTDFSNVLGPNAFNLCHWVDLFSRPTQELIASNPVISIEKLK